MAWSPISLVLSVTSKHSGHRILFSFMAHKKCDMLTCICRKRIVVAEYAREWQRSNDVTLSCMEKLGLGNHCQDCYSKASFPWGVSPWLVSLGIILRCISEFLSLAYLIGIAVLFPLSVYMIRLSMNIVASTYEWLAWPELHAHNICRHICSWIRWGGHMSWIVGLLTKLLWARWQCWRRLNILRSKLFWGSVLRKIGYHTSEAFPLVAYWGRLSALCWKLLLVAC